MTWSSNDNNFETINTHFGNTLNAQFLPLELVALFFTRPRSSTHFKKRWRRLPLNFLLLMQTSFECIAIKWILCDFFKYLFSAHYRCTLMLAFDRTRMMEKIR